MPVAEENRDTRIRRGDGNGPDRRWYGIPMDAPLTAEVSIEQRESPRVRRGYAVVAGVVAVAFAAVAWAFWVPAHPGVDQNGYLVGGKLFAATGSTGFVPADDDSFVGRMWVEVAGKRFYPKYPLGLSVVYAVPLRLFGTRVGVPVCFGVNPAAMTAGLVATFLLGRRLVGSALGVLAMALVATSPVCVGLADNPNSHATAFLCAAGGMYGLVRWWQGGGGTAVAAAAGVLLGAAVTIRYTEGLMLLPLGFVAWDGRRRWAGGVAAVAGWAVPVALLGAYNWAAMRHLTGYDPTNESTGFKLANAAENWETMLRELYNTGLFFTLPLTVVGAVTLFKHDLKVAAFLALWAVPNLGLYVAYYWAPDNASISYLRFTLTVFPALAVATAWGAKQVADGLAVAQASRRVGVGTVAAVVAVGVGVNAYAAVAVDRADAAKDRATRVTAGRVLAAAPAGSVIFAPDNALNFLQLVGDYRLYDAGQFNLRTVQGYATVNPDEPAGLQPQRAKETYDRLKGDDERQLVDRQNAIMSATVAGGHRVFLLYPTRQAGPFDRFTARRPFAVTTVATWVEPAEARKQRWTGVNRPNRPRDEEPQTWVLAEVRPVPPPAAKPATRPATRPVVVRPRRVATTRPVTRPR